MNATRRWLPFALLVAALPRLAVAASPRPSVASCLKGTRDVSARATCLSRTRDPRAIELLYAMSWVKEDGARVPDRENHYQLSASAGQVAAETETLRFLVEVGASPEVFDRLFAVTGLRHVLAELQAGRDEDYLCRAARFSRLRAEVERACAALASAEEDSVRKEAVECVKAAGEEPPTENYGPLPTSGLLGALAKGGPDVFAGGVGLTGVGGAPPRRRRPEPVQHRCMRGALGGGVELCIFDGRATPPREARLVARVHPGSARKGEARWEWEDASEDRRHVVLATLAVPLAPGEFISRFEDPETVAIGSDAGAIALPIEGTPAASRAFLAVLDRKAKTLRKVWESPTPKGAPHVAACDEPRGPVLRLRPWRGAPEEIVMHATGERIEPPAR